MRSRIAVPLVLVIAGALWVWRTELFTVARPGDAPRPLVTLEVAKRSRAEVDVVLPMVPAGMQRVRGGGEVLLIHYWAPWERDSRDQAKALDSLRQEPSLEGLRVVVVCSDPFPSVARYVGRHRLRLAVLLDGPGELRRELPCPSIPYTYVLDRSGRIAVAQAGEVDWWNTETLRTLQVLLGEPKSVAISARTSAP